MRILSLLFLFFILISCGESPNERSSLNADWKFSETNDTLWRKATVPGTVQTDLLALGEIPDPFILLNEDSIQWVSERNWDYKKSFSVSSERLKKQKHFIRFEGLDTYATVLLNDSLILSVNNAFRSWEVDVSNALQLENELTIHFKSVDSIEQIEAAKLPYVLPESPRVFTRKPQFQYGWDWGPTIKTMGIWRDISLISYEQTRLKDAYLKTENLNVSDSTVILTANLELFTQENNIVTIDILNQTTGVTSSQQLELCQGANEYQVLFEIENPQFWWTHNLGEPFLYDIAIHVKQGNSIIDSLRKKIGLRTIELVTEKDEIGESFYFKLNGKPVYMKGANYIPQNIFLSEVKVNDREKLLNDVVDANMNMLRVWGGGVYEDEAFYNVCDEKGILVWQDFMFACAMYPGDESFIENVKQEAIENVKRLRNHPSIALWCGNNENSEGWARWGWADNKSPEVRAKIWSDYSTLFNHVLPRVVDSLHPSVSYWESSPKYGRGDKRFKTEGDAHDWWVWHDEYPFEHFEEEVPRFMSEFGFQAFPSYEAIYKLTGLDTINLSHSSFATHQKHDRGFSLIRKYMERDFPVPTNDADYAYVSQLVQAYGITKGIRAHRRSKPYNMGTLYWQLNDCWPVVSWSSIDGLGNWKALHHYAQRAFENRLIIPFEENHSLKITVVDDNFRTITADMYVLFRDFKGQVLHQTETEVVSTFNDKNEVVYEVNLTEIDFDRRATYAEIVFGNIKEIYFFEKPKDLKLDSVKVAASVALAPGGFAITLQEATLQKDVFLSTKQHGKFSHNFFDLLPNEPRVILLKTNEKMIPKIEIHTLNQLIDIP
ncbi:MAG: beta-mannosidase [Candidatus Latescibacterota bacterium]|jgi:beta-mannosidase